MDITKKEKPFDFSLVVDYYDIFSNLLEDIKKVDRFAQCTTLPARYPDGYSDIYPDIYPDIISSKKNRKK